MRLKKKFNWEIWLENPKEIENSFNFYLKKEVIKQEKDIEFLPISHVKKAEYNLRFINFLNENQKFYDWIIVGCYYAIYH